MSLGIGIGIGTSFLEKTGTSTPPVLDYIVTELAFASPNDIIETEAGVLLIIE